MKPKKLTIDDLMAMDPHTIFASGTFYDDLGGCNIANTGKEVPWVAVRGGIHDWAIYCQNPHYVESEDIPTIMLGMGGRWDNDKITRLGDKIFTEKNIRKLVPCTKKAFEMYRY